MAKHANAWNLSVTADFENPRRLRIPEPEDCPPPEIFYYRAVVHTYHALLAPLLFAQNFRTCGMISVQERWFH